MYVHPVVLQLESALASDSLRTLCRVLAGASGRITPARDDPDRKKKPIMDASLTIRAFLRFVELRHGAGDDLVPADFVGKCGSGVRVLLRKCREYQSEVFAALQTRVDDVVKMIRAFYDQTALLSKFQPFFRTVIEAATPAILARKREPLSRLVSFLEAYGDIQLTFLYDASLLGALSSRLNEFEPSQLLDTTEAWMKKARGGQLAIIMTNKVRVLVRAVALFEFPLSPEQRVEWAASAIWASVPEMSHTMQRLEVRVREGMIERADPGELLGLAVALSMEAAEEELFELLGRLLRKAFATAGPERAGEVLCAVESRPGNPYPEAMLEALEDVSAHFAREASGEQLELLLERWVKQKFALTSCPRSVAAVLQDRGAEGLPPGPTARSGEHLAGLGVDDEALAPVVEKLLDRPSGWALGREADCSVSTALALLGRHLWPAAEAPLPRLAEAEAALRLVGPAQSPARGADAAAARLGGMLAAQLPGRSEQVEAAITAWHQGGEGSDGRLAAVVAPLLLEEAKAGTLGVVEEGAGNLARSAALLAKALRAEPLGLRSAEWALGPFAGADEQEAEAALAAVAAACGAGGASEAVVEVAGRRWIEEESPPGRLGPLIVEAALEAWEEEGTRGAGLETLRQVYSWLSEEVRGLMAKSSVEPGAMSKVLLQVQTLLKAMDGVAPTIAELKRAREGALSKIGLPGKAAVLDAVAMAWSATLPGLTPGLAAAHFELYWNGVEGSRATVASLVEGVVEELQWQSRLRLQATFGQVLPPGMQGPPAWRLEGRRKVPWFVPEELVSEAYGPEGEARLAEMREKTPSRNTLLKSPAAAEKAKNVTSGSCMYCGCVAGELKATHVFPEDLGGLKLDSNLSAVCPLCSDFLSRLGPRKWSEALMAKPQKAAEVWWEAQKKANMKTLEFLSSRKDATLDLKPRT